MQHIVNIYEAKTNLSKWIERALAGEEVILAKSNKPLIVLKPYAEPPKHRVPGLLRGKLNMRDDFDDEDPEILRMFGIID